MMIAVEHSNDKFPCIRALLDNTSATAWLKKSSFVEDNPAFQLARDYAKFTIENGVRLQSEHIAGCFNPIADSLSRDHHLSPFLLTHLFIHFIQNRCQTL